VLQNIVRGWENIMKESDNNKDELEQVASSDSSSKLRLLEPLEPVEQTESLSLFERYDCKPLLGAKITISDHFPVMFISEDNEVICYTGIRTRDTRYDTNINMQPYYLKGKHSFGNKSSNEIIGFYRVTKGRIVLDEFIDNHWLYKEKSVKQIDNVGIILPKAARTYYSIWVNHEDDDDLARAVFGLTCDELHQLLKIFKKQSGNHYYDRYSYPRMTRSNSTNFCDITDMLIPEHFPYITFNESGYVFSHVSLFGFYQLLRQYAFLFLSSSLDDLLAKISFSEIAKNALNQTGSDYITPTLTRDVLKIVNKAYDKDEM